MLVRPKQTKHGMVAAKRVVERGALMLVSLEPEVWTSLTYT